MPVDKKNRIATLFKNPWNLTLVVLIAVMLLYGFIHRDEQGRTIASRVYELALGGDDALAPIANLLSEGCDKPPRQANEVLYSRLI